MLSGSSEIWLVSVRADTELLRFIRCVCAVRCARASGAWRARHVASPPLPLLLSPPLFVVVAVCCCSLRTAPVAPPPGIGTLRVCDTGTRIQPTEKRSAGRSRWRGCRCRCLSPGQGAPAPTLPPEGEELSARSSIFPGSLPAPRRAPVLFISAAPARLRCGVTGIYAELSTRRLFHLSRANCACERESVEVGPSSSSSSPSPSPWCQHLRGVPARSPGAWCPPRCCCCCSSLRRRVRPTTLRAESAEAKGRSAQVRELLLLRGAAWRCVAARCV